MSHSIKEYKIVKAKEFLCVPACLEIILSRHDIQISQEVIAEYFGVFVSKDYNGSIRKVTLTDNENDWGVQIQKAGLNDFFKEFSLPLFETYIHHSTFDEILFEKILNGNINDKNSDIICGYDYGYLNSIDLGIGHASVILGFENENIWLIDPGPKGFGEKKYPVNDFITAIKKKNDGIWLIKKLD